MVTVILFGTAGLCAIALGLFLRSLDKPKRAAVHQRRSAMFAGDVTDTVIIDCETDADVVIAGAARNVTMENVRHTPQRSAFGEWTEEAAEKCRTADWVKATEHELGIKGHEDTCDICGPKRTCRQLDKVGANGMVAWCPIGQGEKVCTNCSWTGSWMIEVQR
jgi:hypothetical protein